MSRKLQEEFILTKHAQDRLRERFPEHMEEINFEQSSTIRVRKMHEFLWNASPENRVINDTMFMSYIQEKYGYDRSFRFFANQDMLFIGVIDNNGKYIVTVVNRCNYASRHLHAPEQKQKKKIDTYHQYRTKRSPFKMKRREYLETDLSNY